MGRMQEKFPISFRALDRALDDVGLETELSDGMLDLAAALKTGELSPDALDSFATLTSAAGRTFGPRGGAETLAAGGKRIVARAAGQPRGGHHWVPGPSRK